MNVINKRRKCVKTGEWTSRSSYSITSQSYRAVIDFAYLLSLSLSLLWHFLGFYVTDDSLKDSWGAGAPCKKQPTVRRAASKAPRAQTKGPEWMGECCRCPRPIGRRVAATCVTSTTTCSSRTATQATCSSMPILTSSSTSPPSLQIPALPTQRARWATARGPGKRWATSSSWLPLPLSLD